MLLLLLMMLLFVMVFPVLVLVAPAAAAFLQGRESIHGPMQGPTMSIESKCLVMMRELKSHVSCVAAQPLPETSP